MVTSVLGQAKPKDSKCNLSLAALALLVVLGGFSLLSEKL
jgi:hypothetical protein